jgi:hypothetical protein
MTKNFPAKSLIESHFNDFNFFYENIYYGKLPDLIFEELVYMAEECRKIKNHPLSYLKFHDNARYTSYQVSIPVAIVDQSFTLAFLNHLGEHFSHIGLKIPKSELYRKIRLKKYHGHFDGYDFWTIFSHKGDHNPLHIHRPHISGVIYITENDLPTTFVTSDGKEIDFLGKKGEIVIFPSNFQHYVKEKTSDPERITMSFNLEYVESI